MAIVIEHPEKLRHDLFPRALYPQLLHFKIGGAVVEWVRALAWAGDRTVLGRVRAPLR